MDTYLYGIGKKTEKYMAEHRDLAIKGILDGYRKEGEFQGIPVLALEDIDTENTRIIIVARPASARIIYARIKKFCIEKKVEIYDAGGRKMEPEQDIWLLEPEKIKIDTKKLYLEIDRHDVVSFDIFDTLLVRKCGSVENLFKYVAMKSGLPQSFVDERIRAEKELSQNMVPAIEDIYQRIAENMAISQEESRRILMEEIEEEKHFLVVRRGLAEAFYYAIRRGKLVILISDMYLRRKILEEILTQKGLVGYKNLFVSSEYGTDKTGNLYDLAIGKIAGKSWLHIGDDGYRDDECARGRGMDVFLIRTTTEMLGWNLASPETIGYSMLAPAMFSFVLWLEASLREDGIRRIYFFARDGYLIKRIFDLVERRREAHGMKDSIVSEYLLISRSLSAAASLQEEDDIRRLMGMSFDGGPVEMLKKRFYLSAKDILPFETFMDQEKYILGHTTVILTKARQLRENYLTYLEKAGLAKDEKTAVFDFVSTGTCQICLEQVLNKKLYGFYYETVEKEGLWKHIPSKRGFIQELGGGQYSCDNYFEIEPLIKESVPTLRMIDSAGRALYGEECMKPCQKELIGIVQAEVMKYVRDRLDLVPKEKFGLKEARDNVLKMKRITTKFLGENSSIQNYDAFSNRKIVE